MALPRVLTVRGTDVDGTPAGSIEGDHVEIVEFPRSGTLYRLLADGSAGAPLSAASRRADNVSLVYVSHTLSQTGEVHWSQP